MRTGDIELRHIVDVDGRLIGIDADVVDASTLLRRAGSSMDRHVFLVRAGERTAVAPHERLRLSEREVLFFETVPTPLAWDDLPPFPSRLAA
jgi:hypothetical protein